MVVHLPGVTPPEGANLAIRIELTAQANITPFVARQKVTRFLVTEISTQLQAGTPELVVGERLCWSVPAVFTCPVRGVVGKVGAIVVDATCGELLVDEEIVRSITENARSLAERSPR
jgi:hypothetical protein